MISRPQDPLAIVVPCSAPNAYGTIRSLAAAGVRVLALDHHESPLRRSRLCRFSVVPDPDGDPGRFIDALRGLAARLDAPPVLFPTQDLHALVIQQHRATLDGRVRFPFIDVPAFMACIDKRIMMREAAAAGLPVPESHAPECAADLERILPRLTRFPYIVKPVAKFEIEDGAAVRNMAFFDAYGTKALRADTAADLVRVFGDTERRRLTVLVQEFIEGPTGALSAVDFYVDGSGRLRAYHTGRKMRQFPADFGTCTLGRSVPVPGVVDLCRAFVERTGFRGIGNMEFKERGGVPYLMEINPRPWMWIQLATRAGVNLPHLAWLDLVERPASRYPEASGDARWVDLRMDVLHRPGAPGDPGREDVGLLAWLGSLAKVRVEARSTLADPAPALDAIACGVGRRVERMLGHR